MKGRTPKCKVLEEGGRAKDDGRAGDPSGVAGKEV